MRCFDFDTPDAWRAVYEPYFSQLAPVPVWDQLLDLEDYHSGDSNFTKLASQLAPTGANAESWLRDRAQEFFAANYTHGACYHSCRIIDPDSYLRDGLRLCDIAEQNRLAEHLWGKSEKLDRAIAASGWYAKHNHGQVGLWFTREGAAHDGDGYSAGGSEYLRGLANELGPEARELLHTRGRPAILRCVLTLSELGDSNVRHFAYLPFKRRLTSIAPDAPPGFYAIDSAFMHSARIPAERLTIEYLNS